MEGFLLVVIALAAFLFLALIGSAFVYGLFKEMAHR